MPDWAQRAIDALERHGVHVRVLVRPADGRHDLVLELTARGETRTYAAELKSRVTAASIGALSSRMSGATLLIAPHLTPSQSEDCRRLGIAYADGAGNIFLDWDTVLVDVQGRRPARSGPSLIATRPPRAFRPSGLRVVFCLLSDPQLSSRPYRDIARASGAALGSVQWVMAELINLNYVESQGRQRRLHHVRELFDKWLHAYALNLYPSLLLERYEGDRVRAHLARETPVERFGVQWGGEAAVALQDRYLRPATLVLYAPTIPTKLLSAWKLRKAPEGGNVIIRRRFWDGSFLPGPIAPSTLVYADLVASGDPRQIEAAHRLREKDALLRSIDRR